MLALGLAATLVALIATGAPRPEWRATAVLAFLAWLAEWNRNGLRVRTTLSLTGAFVVVSTALVGPFGAILVGAIAHGLLPKRRTPSARLFNPVMASLFGAAGGVAYQLAGGLRPVTPATSVPDLIWHVLIPLLLADVAVFAVNMLCIAMIMTASTDSRFFQSLRAVVTPSWLPYAGYGFIAFLFVVLWAAADLGVLSIVLMATPLMITQWALQQQYAEREGHQRTIQALVAAAEVRDPVMRGHSARVEAISRVIGGELRLGTQDADALSFAALLHDIGMVTPRPGVERTALAALTPSDLHRVSGHPQRGVQMLEGIDFLTDAVDAIHHHHERWDGRGYPDGLRATAIPQLARIIAVSDAYAALTAPHRHPQPLSGEQAAAEISGRAGSQLDPECTAALARALDRVERALSGLGEDIEPASGESFDHDMPQVSDWLAGPVTAATRS